MIKTILCLMLLWLEWPALAAAAPGSPVLEAECLVASDSRIVEAPAASGGKAVTNGRAWQPLVSVPVPEQGETFSFWIRHRGGPVLCKAVTAGKQREIKGIWARPEDWTWTLAGRFNRAELGEQVLVLRGQGEVMIDAVVLTADAAYVPPGMEAGPALPPEVTAHSGGKRELPPEHPDASLPPLPVTVTVAWEQKAGEMPLAMWGVADYEILVPKNAADIGFNRFLTELAPPVIRIHQGSFPKPWLDAEQKHVDVAKIKACWAGATGYGNTRLLFSISTWPDWMKDKDGALAVEREDDYAALCVELLTVMRDQVGRRVDAWEITNEKDGQYEKLNRLPDLWRLYNKVVDAMRKADPAAKFGGPAFTWAKPAWVEGFVKNCLDRSDFVTYHQYGVGEVFDANEKLFGTLPTIEKNARFIRETVDQAGGGRAIPIYLDEYNVKWTWTPMERRHGNSVGAVFQAGVLRRAALAGINGANVWHLKGNAYGILDGANRERLTAPLFKWGPRYLAGTLATATVSDDGALEVLPVLLADGNRSMLIGNKANRTITVTEAAALLGGRVPAQILQINAEGMTVLAPAEKPLELPGYSLTLITTVGAR